MSNYPSSAKELQIAVLHFLLLTRDVKVKCPLYEAFLEDVKKIAPLINLEIIWSFTIWIRVLFLTRKREVKEGKLRPVSFAPVLLGIISGMADEVFRPSFPAEATPNLALSTKDYFSALRQNPDSLPLAKHPQTILLPSPLIRT